jgi:hypothetical protein
VRLALKAVWERFKHARDAVVLELDLKLDYLVGAHDYSLGTQNYY